MHPLRRSHHTVPCPAAMLVSAFLALALHGAPLKAGSELDHPVAATAPGAAAAAARPAPFDSLAVDPLELWIRYYYVNPEPERLPEMLRAAVAQGAFAPSSPRAREHLRFFAAAAAAEPAALAAIRTAAEAGSGQDKAILLAVAAKAGHYAPPVVEVPDDIAQLWAEYRATGSEATIKAVIELVGIAESADPNGLARAAAASLLEQVPRQVSAAQALNDAYLTAQEPLKGRLAPIVAKINERYDLARMLNGRANNYVTAKQVEEAIKSYRAAIEVYPAYHWAYTEFTKLLLNEKREGDYPVALAASRVAAALEPDKAHVVANLGWVHFRMKEYGLAIAAYDRALACDPKHAYSAYMLGHAAMKQNDPDAALGHFNRYLKLEPAGGRLDRDEVRFLAAKGVRPELPAAPSLTELLKQKKFALIEERLRELSLKRTKDPTGGSPLLKAFKELTDLPDSESAADARIKLFREWAVGLPTSWVAATALGDALVKHAWMARGSGFANTVLDDRGRLFAERLLEARSVLEAAYGMDPGQPVASIEMIEVVKGLGLGRDELDKHFQRAVQADATLGAPYYGKMTILLPKWGGSAEEALAFARAAAAAAPPGSPVAMVLSDAHRELDYDLQRTRHDRGYYRNAEVWNELKPLYERHLVAFPAAVNVRNIFALVAYRAGDPETARRQLELLGEDRDPGIWGGLTELKKAQRELAAR